MPFVKGNVSDKITEKREQSLIYKQAWDNSREKYQMLGERIKRLKNPEMKAKVCHLTETINRA